MATIKATSKVMKCDNADTSDFQLIFADTATATKAFFG